MKCVTARAAIDAQSASFLRSDELRFHLANCAACRSYRAAQASWRIDDAMLLDTLLREMPEGFVATPHIAESISSPGQVSARRTASPVRRVINVLLIGGAIALMLLVGTVALAAAMIHRNIQAMIVPTTSLPVRVATIQAVVPTLMPSAIPSLTQATSVSRVTSSPIVPSPSPIVPSPSLMPQRAVQAPSLPTLMPTSQIPYALDPNAINIVVIGSDKRPDDEGDTRADTIMLVRVDPQRQRIALLSLPRDLIVSIPGYGQGRINAANAYGGVDLVRSTVSNLLGIPIDYYVSVNFDGFIAVVDSVGGVDVNVETELYDPEFPTMDYGYTEAHFLPGIQHMDGVTALMYSRIRHPDSDYNRMKRQQQVALAVGTALQKQNALQSIQSLVSMSSALRGYVQTDMPENTMLGLAWSFHALSSDAVERYTLGADQVSENVIPGDPYASFALPGAIENLVQEFIGPQ